jgi:hypothetical protein
MLAGQGKMKGWLITLAFLFLFERAEDKRKT